MLFISLALGGVNIEVEQTLKVNCQLSSPAANQCRAARSIKNKFETAQQRRISAYMCASSPKAEIPVKGAAAFLPV